MRHGRKSTKTARGHVTFLLALVSALCLTNAILPTTGLAFSITATATGSVNPPTATYPDTVTNGDFQIATIPRTPFIGDGIDEGTLWNFNMLADPSYAAFLAQGMLTSARLTLTLTPKHPDVSTDQLGIRVLGVKSAPAEIQNLPLDVTTTVDVELLSEPFYTAEAILDVLARKNGQLAMLYGEDAIVSFAQLVLVGCTEDALLAGVKDNFAPPADPTSPSPGLVASDSYPLMGFDVIPQAGGVKDRKVAHTFTDLPADSVEATLTLRAKPGSGGLATASDTLVLGFYGPGLPNTQWGRTFPAITPSGTWSPGGSAETITLDLTALPLANGSTVNLVPQINTHGFLDVKVADDTGVDYYELTVRNCASPVE